MQACLGEGSGCGRGSNTEEIWKVFYNGRWGGLFAEYYVKLSIAQRAVETYKADKSAENYDLMVIAIKDARNAKRYASRYVPQADVTLDTQTYPSILGGGYIDTEYSLGDEFAAPGMVDPGDPFNQEAQTSTPTLTPTPTQKPNPISTPNLTPTPSLNHRLIPTPRKYGGEIID